MSIASKLRLSAILMICSAMFPVFRSPDLLTCAGSILFGAGVAIGTRALVQRLTR